MADLRVIRMMGIDLDVTERVRAEQVLRDSDRRKDEFLATLSHELQPAGTDPDRHAATRHVPTE